MLILRTTCELLAFPQGYAYPRLRIACLDPFDVCALFVGAVETLLGTDNIN
jgi:hypothetical protein